MYLPHTRYNIGVTWGDDVVLNHPADARCAAAAAAGFFDPWAEEAPKGRATGAETKPVGDLLSQLQAMYPGEEVRVDLLGRVGRLVHVDASGKYHVASAAPRPSRAGFDPWADEARDGSASGEAAADERAEQHMAEQNRRDCDDADTAGVLNPPMDTWMDDAILGRDYGESPGPRPAEFHSALRARPDEPPAPVKLEPDGSDLKRRAGARDDYDNFDDSPDVSAARGASASAHPAAARAPGSAAASYPTVLAGGPSGPTQFATLEPKLRKMLTFAGKLGLLGALPGNEISREGESAVARDLRLGVLTRARQTYDVGKLDTALKWFEEFNGVAQRSPLFMPLLHAGDLASMQYNQETLDMFAEYVRRRGSRLRGRSGETIKSDTIQTYVSQIKKLRTHEAHHTIVGPEVNVVGPSAYKRMRQLDGPPRDQGVSLGIRARHLRNAAARGFDRKSKRGTQEWGAALTAHNLLCRGGEVCLVDGNPDVDPARDMVIGAVEFKEPGEVSDGLPWLTVEMVPIKDTTARRRSAVMPVRRRSAGGAIGSDPMDTYDAIVLAIAGRTGRMPPARGRVTGPEAILPLFVGPKGKPWCTTDTRRLARRIAAWLDLDEDLYGGKAFRIGGATDYRAIYGPDAAERIIRQRGRWWSDIHTLYQRALAAEHLEGSAALGDAKGAELEALCKGWAQPTAFL